MRCVCRCAYVTGSLCVHVCENHELVVYTAVHTRCVVDCAYRRIDGE
nr:MAG TPA: hypothetical protein [Caudoviricetes sp.]